MKRENKTNKNILEINKQMKIADQKQNLNFVSQGNISYLIKTYCRKSVEGVIDIKTVKRDEQHWHKYYADNKLITIPIKKITT